MIEAISRGCKGTLSDGTLRYVVDISPKDAAAAAELFGMPGSPMVLARLTQDAAIHAAQSEVVADQVSDAGKPIKCGALAKWAGILCNDPVFAVYVDQFPTPEAVENIFEAGGHVNGEEYSRMYVINKCNITSRAELDHNPEAGRIFREQIMAPFAAWKESV